ncbi:cytochrome P450 [Deinococcus cellulosilyticus]|uniref:Cytochrome P450 n=1 Tax=Deinococcus cellulosilyticus (strain DSM 18568 / NBRC 106333 / KACC 11606 / 5516J-15) TaxID=1223518 RepID=A0A511N926_DEIC1|nr:cytochrome P450 [Deinococcus cellulosilyticus]GEM49037.1 cytochrome P450 [Deinococcus cellulosilyticus NBRC 106333 = KACC 11606]
MQDIQNLFTAEGIQNPYPFYDNLRNHSPAIYMPDWNSVFVTGHPENAALLRDPRASVERLSLSAEDLRKPEFMPVNALYHMMLFRDPPNHTRLRSLVSQAFTPRVVAEMRGLIEELLDDILDGVAAQDGMEVLQDLAGPLPVTVIVKMLGLNAEDASRFKRWSESIAVLLDGGVESQIMMPRIMQDVQDMNVYFRRVADDLRENPQPGLMTALAGAELEGDKLSSEELLSNAVLLLVAGHETTTNLIASGLHALITHPEQLADLRAHPELMDGAVEELLRFVSPVQATSRVLKGEMEIAGQNVPAGTQIQVMLAAANRDPRVFHDPHTLNLRRDASKHLALAAGHHYCLGASLARLEAKVVFEKLLERFSRFELQQQHLTYRPNFTLRGLTELRVRMKR